MILGVPSPQWICSFEKIDFFILNIISHIWPLCLESVSSDSDEDDITAVIVYHLHNSPESRKTPFHVRGQTELYGRHKNKRNIKCRHDIEFFIQGKAIVYECKRTKSKKVTRKTTTTLVDKYVLEGLNRFIKGQYAEHDPFAGMIAYVIDGDAFDIKQQLIDCIAEHALTNGVMAALPSVGSFLRFSSSHKREKPCPTIKIHHVLLPLSPV